MDEEQPIGFVEPTPNGFNRFICPVKNEVETEPVYLGKGSIDTPRKLIGYYDGKDKGLKPSRTQAWVISQTPDGEKRIAVYVAA